MVSCLDNARRCAEALAAQRLPQLRPHQLRVAVMRVVRGMDAEVQRQLDKMERDGIQATNGEARTAQYNQYITGWKLYSDASYD